MKNQDAILGTCKAFSMNQIHVNHMYVNNKYDYVNASGTIT